MERAPKDNVVKIYCERCDTIFRSREKFERHFDQHDSSAACEMCPIDAAISRIARLFQRSRNLE